MFQAFSRTSLQKPALNLLKAFQPKKDLIARLIVHYIENEVREEKVEKKLEVEQK